MKQMKTLTFPNGETYEIHDGFSRTKIGEIEEKKAENVHLYCDGFDIFYFDDKTTPLTFAEVKAIIENDVHSVFLSNDYYSFYGKYYFRPEITSHDKEAIGFIGETQLNGECYSWRVIINEDGEVKEDEIHLAKYSDVRSLRNELIETSTTQPTSSNNKIWFQPQSGEIVLVEKAEFDSLVARVEALENK